MRPASDRRTMAVVAAVGGGLPSVSDTVDFNSTKIVRNVLWVFKE